jgi:hypothetical protein
MHKVRGNYSTVVQVGAMKIYATAASGGAQVTKKKKGGQNRMKLSLPPKKWCPFFRLMYFFLQVLFWNLTRFLDQTQGSPVLCFPDFTENSNR